MSYLVLQLLFFVCIFFNNLFSSNQKVYNDLEIWATIDGSKIVSYWEIIGSCFVAVLIGGTATTLTFYKILNRISERLRISNKYGDENLYSYFLNAKEIEIVYVRHIKNNLSYRGYVKSFSETDSISELVLSNVSIYEYATSELLYEIDQIYLSFTKSEIIIEKANLLSDVN